MTRVAFTADVHIANHRRFGGPSERSLNHRCRLVLDALRRSYRIARDQGCDAYVVLGDLFDDARPLPQMIAEVCDIFDSEGPEVFVLLGNHEMVSSEPGDHALGPLNAVAQVIDEPSTFIPGGDVRLGLVPFRPGPAEEWLPGALEAVAGSDMVGLHLGIADDRTPAYLQGARDSIHHVRLAELMIEHNISSVAAGNWHEKRIWGGSRPIYQIGCLAPTGWDNPGTLHYGWMGIAHPEGFDYWRVPGPRFIRVTSAEEIQRARDEEPESVLFAEWLATPRTIAAAEEGIRTAKLESLILDGGVIVDRQREERAAQQAAATVRSAETLQEALASYVEEMELEPGVDRTAVLEAAKEYLG